jgi:hypothetical protein
MCSLDGRSRTDTDAISRESETSELGRIMQKDVDRPMCVQKGRLT